MFGRESLGESLFHSQIDEPIRFLVRSTLFFFFLFPLGVHVLVRSCFDVYTLRRAHDVYVQSHVRRIILGE